MRGKHLGASQYGHSIALRPDPMDPYDGASQPYAPTRALPNAPRSGERIPSHDASLMGQRTQVQQALFYEFSRESHVPDNHLLRAIDRFVDLVSIRKPFRRFCGDIGDPSVDPELMIRMLLIGYTMGIRSERRLCDEVHLPNLPIRLVAAKISFWCRQTDAASCCR